MCWWLEFWTTRGQQDHTSLLNLASAWTTFYRGCCELGTPRGLGIKRKENGSWKRMAWAWEADDLDGITGNFKFLLSPKLLPL